MRKLRIQFYILCNLLSRRVRWAAGTWPTGQDWGFALGLMVAFALVMVPLTMALPPFAWSSLDQPWTAQVAIGVRTFFVPALLEEGFWRVLLLPHRSEPLTPAHRWRQGGVVLGLFVLFHPLNSLTFYPLSLAVFGTPLFLLGATLLGLICTLAYWRSGSWWLTAMMHWLVVTVWLLGFGGYDQLHASSSTL